MSKNILTLDELAGILHVAPSTVKRYRQRGFFTGEPIMGNPKNGYVFNVRRICRELKETKHPDTAQLIEQEAALLGLDDSTKADERLPITLPDLSKLNK